MLSLLRQCSLDLWSPRGVSAAVSGRPGGRDGPESADRVSRDRDVSEYPAAGPVRAHGCGRLGGLMGVMGVMGSVLGW